jgi:hypothetical protein
LIAVGVAMGGSLGNESVTCADNQGNTYTLETGDNSNDMKAAIFYAFNVVSAGTFTITLTRTGAAVQETIAVAVEYSGLGALDPLVGFTKATGNSGTGSTGTSGVLGAIPEAIVFAVIAARQSVFSVTSLTVEVVAPVWTEEGEHDSACTTCSAGEIDDRIVANGDAQSCSWTIGAHGGNFSAVLAAFYSIPPGASARLTQFAKETLEQDGTVSLNLTQFAREVLYPFTCVPGLTPTTTGCPEALPLAPVQGSPGCPPDAV